MSITNLTENSQYFYNVRATLGSAVSLPSETIGIHTLLNNKIVENKQPAIKILSNKEHISISGLTGDEQLQVYTLSGISIHHDKVNSTAVDITNKQNGIFLIRIQNQQYSIVYKIIK